MIIVERNEKRKGFPVMVKTNFGEQYCTENAAVELRNKLTAVIGDEPLSSSRPLDDARINELLDFVEYACVRFAYDQEDAIKRGEDILIKYGRIEKPRVI